MTNLSLNQMEEICKKQYNSLGSAMKNISSVLEEREASKMKSLDDLRELSGKIKVFVSGKLKQLNELIENLKLIETGEKPQSDPPLYMNDVQGFYDLTMIEARKIDQSVKDLLPDVRM